MQCWHRRQKAGERESAECRGSCQHKPNEVENETFIY
jgi:hypothetical protein